MCKNSLFGNILQMNIITSFSDQCDYENDICKAKLMEQLENSLSQLLSDTITIQFADDRFTSINVKLCNLTDIIGKKEVTSSEESQP
jgi:hypothetical protein